MFTIINNHLFTDGNKRTGLEAALLFFQLNGYQLQEQLVPIYVEEKRVPTKGDSSSDILANFTLEVASSSINIETCQDWFRENIRKL